MILSPRIEMHDIKITNDIAKMVMVKKVVVKRKGELYLQPGGKHLMFFWNKKKTYRWGFFQYTNKS